MRDLVAELREWLAHGPHVIDGGLATELERDGYDLGDDLWSARLLRDDPAAVERVHERYFAAGATVATTASYQASRRGFLASGLDPDAADELLRRSVELARSARDRLDDGVRRWVAASVGPYGAVLAGGEEYVGRYGVGAEDMTAFHSERLAVLEAAGPDLFAVETIPDVTEVRAVAAALVAHPHVPAWVSVSCRDGATTNAGDPVEDVVAAVAGTPNVVAVGVNCTAPEFVPELLGRLDAARREHGVPRLALLAYPNSGRVWDAATRSWVGQGAVTLPDAAVAQWLDAGASVVGGCCGLGPEAITAMTGVIASR